MKIAYLSSFPPMHCGIGTYSNYLIKSILKNSNIKIVVLSHYTAKKISQQRFQCIPFYGKNEDALGEVCQRISSINPDLVHVQHECGMYGPPDNFINFARELRRLPLKKVITIHTVHTPQTVDFPIEIGIKGYHHLIEKCFHAIVVHSNHLKRLLIKQGIPAKKIRCIPHGTKMLKRISAPEARSKLGLSKTDKIILAFGFVKPRKNQIVIIKALPEILSRVPKARFLIAGSSRGAGDLQYLTRCQETAGKLGCSQAFTTHTRFIPHGQEYLYFSAGDIAVYPSGEPFPSVSGALHLGLGAGKPPIVSDIPRFTEIKENISPEIVISPYRPSRWAKAIVRMIEDRPFRNEIVKKVEQYAQQTTWKQSALRHIHLYQELLALNMDFKEKLFVEWKKNRMD